jgi:PAS domain S-box-containing protein
MKLSENQYPIHYELFPGGGETGEMVRSTDWSATSLGPVDNWPISLKTCVRIVLSSRQPVCIWWGKELICIYNDAHRDVLGKKHPAAFGQPAPVVWKEIWQKISPNVKSAIRNNTVNDDEAILLIKEKNGQTEEAYYTFSYSPVPGDDGSISGIICTITNDSTQMAGDPIPAKNAYEITDIVQAKQKAEASEKRYRQLIYGLPAAVYTCDKNGCITLYNDAAVLLWGEKPKIGKNTWFEMAKIFEEDGYTPVTKDNAPVAIALKNGRPARGRELVIERKDGSRVNVEPYTQPILDASGEVLGALELMMDITERKMAEKHVAHLAAIVESSEDAIVGKNLNGIVTSWNHGAERLFGYTSEEMIGQSIARLFPPERINEEPQILERIRRGENIKHYETVRVRKNGEYIDISLTISPVKDSKQNVIGASKIARDITAQKKLDLALRESERRYKQIAKELEKRVLDRTRELTEANQYLERSNNELEQFAFVTSHDLQEPLRKIQTFANLLQARSKDDLDETGNMYVEKIVSASRRMSKLIYDLLNFSRLTKFEEPFERTDLNTILTDIKSDFEIVILQKNAELIIRELPVIDAIPLQMNQLFHNLISNALKFAKGSQRPRIVVTAHKLSHRKKELYSRLDAGKTYYEIVVKDNGIGFDPSYSEKIFEIFQRLNDKSRYEGTGIGLALCQKIVVNHHGLIFADSKENEGAAFHVILPEHA